MPPAAPLAAASPRKSAIVGASVGAPCSRVPPFDPSYVPVSDASCVPPDVPPDVPPPDPPPDPSPGPLSGPSCAPWFAPSFGSVTYGRIRSGSKSSAAAISAVRAATCP
ncbi:hypothetical protein DT87_07300 [Streptomyces sp. NTK 937]|nr:hypothetical protein DT87_07300 [Streptomyces sp. NTK 937]